MKKKETVVAEFNPIDIGICYFTLQDILDRLEEIKADYPDHELAAREIQRKVPTNFGPIEETVIQFYKIEEVREEDD